VKISAKADYAVRACLELARAQREETWLKGDAISRAQGVPVKFLENIMIELRRAEIVRSQRGADGGYQLALAADAITIADVIRAVDGPLAYVRGERPEAVEYAQAATHLPSVWIALRASIRSVLEAVSLTDALDGNLPQGVFDLIDNPEAWTPH
jgi:Rrf2 family protein